MLLSLSTSFVNIQRRHKAYKYGYISHDVKVPCPPKVRSKLWKLPVHRKLLFVANGHVYDWASRKPKEPPTAIPTTALGIVKCNSFKLIATFTKSEMEFLFENANAIRAMFDEQEKLTQKLEEQDAASKHVCI